jgi:hypothetical protein
MDEEKLAMVCRHSQPEFICVKQQGKAVAAIFARLVNFTPYLVGSLLLLAAALKVQHLLRPEQPTTDFLGSRWFLVGLVDVEVLTGLALVLGFWRALTRSVCVLLFLGFLASSAYRVAAGAKSCACLGSVDVGPLAMTTLDAVVLAALWLWRPPLCAIGRKRFGLVAPLLMTSSVVLATSWFVWTDPKPLVTVFPSVVDLGTVSQGESQRFSVLLRNQHDVPITVTRVDVSCPCLIWRQANLSVEPFAELQLEFELDLAKEPTFVGALRVEVRGGVQGSQPSFVLVVKVDVEEHPCQPRGKV